MAFWAYHPPIALGSLPVSAVAAAVRLAVVAMLTMMRAAVAIVLGAASMVALPQGSQAAPTPPIAPEASAVTVRLAAGATLPLRVGAPRRLHVGTVSAWEPAAAGSITVYPCDQPRPRVPTAVFGAKVGVTTLVAAPADANGYLCFHATAATHLTWDQLAEPDRIEPTPPAVVLDTQSTGAMAKAGAVTRLTMATGGQTMFGTLVVTSPTGTGRASVYPCATGLPAVPNLLYAKGQNVSTAVLVQPDSRAEICVHSSAGAHLALTRAATTAGVTPSSPKRLFDSRVTGKLLPAGSVTTLRVAAGRQTVAAYLTTMLSGAAGAVTVYPCSSGRPVATSAQFAAGKSTTTLVLTSTDDNGAVCLHTSAAVHLQWDQVVATTSLPAHDPVRQVDTRPRNESAAFAFAQTIAGAPARWPACGRTLRVVVNRGAVSSEAGNLSAALSRLTAATGIPIVVADTTSVIPKSSNGYGFAGPDPAPTAADIIVAFTQPGQTDLLNGREYARAGFVTPPGSRAITSGFAVFDQRQLKSMSPAMRTTMYMHELAHVLGLGHTTADPSAVMSPTLSSRNATGAWAPGDVTGLRRVGVGAGCTP